jgi:hypothetical protein
MDIKVDIKEIYENAMNDPTLFSTIDIDSLLNKIEKEDNNYLENKRLSDISKDIFDAISELNLNGYKDKDNDLAKDFCNRLSGYRYVERICDLRNGKLMRWIKRPSNNNITDSKKVTTLTNGGILMNIKIENSGVQLLCRNNANRFFNIKFDDCLVFQKLSMEEQLILMSYEYIDSNI